MSISSERPVSAEQVYAALAALGAAPVADPDLRPEGPLEEDRLHLLGSLLAKTELEITASTRRPEDEEIVDIFDAVVGWNEQVGPESDLATSVLVNRLERTAMQVSESDSEEPAPGREASFAAVMAATFALAAQLHAERGDAAGTRQALGGVEEAVIDVLQNVHALRVVIGDAQGSED
ncbi:hypothetical protein ABZ135_23495 [Streptomyces sp. NPDC006339]|uniref:hypothetical protein n=1 Tax=Streptomyces sp. NPDC006339 TaxID=3156755 RepID=UPI0033BD7192